MNLAAKQSFAIEAVFDDDVTVHYSIGGMEAWTPLACRVP